MTPDDARRATAARYDTASIALHWATAFLVGLLWVMGQTIDYWPAGTLRIDYRSLHITFGALLGLILLARIFWRSTQGARLPVEGPRLLALAARLVHWLLYILVGSTVALGLVTTWARGDTLFNLFSLPSFAPGNRALAHQIFSYHSLAADAVLILVCGTVGLGLVTTWARGDNLFNLFSLPSFAPGDKALAHQIFSYHSLAADAVLILAGLHAAAALAHHYVMRDDTLRRMLPGRRPA